MPLEGVDNVLRNLAALGQRMQQAAAEAADESAILLETYAKQTAPFKDRTGNLRNSIKGTWGNAPGGFRIVLSAGMSYAPPVEFGHFAKRNTTRYSTRAGRATTQRISDRAFGTGVQARAFIWPSVAANAPRVLEIFKRRLSV